MRARILFALIFSLFTVTASAQTISYIGPPTAVGSGLQSGEFTVRLSDSQHGGIFLSLASGDSNLVLVAPDDDSVGAPSVSHFVPNGSTDARFVVQGLEGVTGTVTVTASAPGFTDQPIDVDVVGPAFRILGLASSINLPAPDDAFYVSTGRLNAAGTSWAATEAMRIGGPGTTVTFTVGDAAVGELVTTPLTGQTVDVGLVGGDSNTPTSVVAGGVAFATVAPGPTDVTVTVPGFTGLNGGVQAITVNPATMRFVGMPADVGAGLRTTALRVQLNGSAHGGTTVHLASVDSSRVLLSAGEEEPGQGSLDLFIPDGTIQASFWAHGLEGVLGIGPVHVTAPGFPDISEGVEVVTPHMDIQGLAGSIDTLDPVDQFYVRVGVPNSSVTGLTYVQEVRPGAPGLDVALICDDPAVGLLETQTDYGDTVWARIEAGESNTPTVLAAGGVAFDGVGLGTANVRPEIAGFTPTANALRQVDVSQPGINLQGVPAAIGAGLQGGSSYVQLQASAHGGTTVHLELDDPSLALMSGDADTVGSGSLDLFVADGSTIAYFYLQALESGAGVVNITASAPGFDAVADSFDVVAPGILLLSSSLSSTISTIDPPDAFYARVGAPNGAGTSVTAQALRAGSAGLEVTATVAEPLLAQLVTLTDTLSTVTATMVAGQSNTPTSVATGGFGFDGLAPGTAHVTVSAPGFVPVTAATDSVVVTEATFTMFGSGDVGAGLLGSLRWASLSGSAHGGTTVRFEVSDSTLALVAPNATDVGRGAIDVFVADGSSIAYFQVQGLDDVTGSVTVSASAPGVATNQVDIDIVQPAVEIRNLAATLDVTDPDDNFQVRVGLPNGTNSSVGSAQARRPGAPPLEATVVCTDSTVANLVSLSGVAGSRHVDIVAGQNQSPSTVAQGGLALRGVGTGSTLVTAAIPGFLPVGTTTREVDVTQSGIAVLGVPAALGLGLQTSPLVARLNDSGHGGVTVRIAADDPGEVLVSGDPAAAGSDTLVVALPNGQVDVVFYLQALDGTAGSATVTATAVGFDDGTRSLQLVAPAVALTLLPDSLDVQDPADPFVVQVGVPLADATGLARTQVVRAGAVPLLVSVVLDDGSLADLVTSGGDADSVGVAIVPGQFQTAGTVAAGGVALDGSSAGPVAVTASAPGFAPVTTSSQVVLIVGDLSAAGDVPAVFALHGNHPNPFNPATTIAFSLARGGDVRLDVFDVRGRRVRSLVSGPLAAGPHEVRWDGTDAGGRQQATGVYLIRLVTPEGVRTGKMALVK